MKTFITIVAILYSTLSFSVENGNCDKDVVETPLDLNLVTFIENVDSILPIRNFAVVLRNETTGETFTSITDATGTARYKSYKPQKSNRYSLSIYKSWDWINKDSQKLLCSTEVNSEQLVKIHESVIKGQNKAFALSSLNLVLDQKNFIDDDKSCKFIGLERPTYEYRKL